MERDIGRAILGLRIQLIETHSFYFSSSLVSLRGKMGTCVDGDLLHSRGRASGGGARARGGWRKTYEIK